MSQKPITTIFRATRKSDATRDVNLHLERRADRRTPVLSGELPGEIRLAGTSKSIEAGAINVSVGGLCVWLAESIVPGGIVELVIPGRNSPIPLTVAYCRQSVESDERAKWICGMKLSSLRVESLVKIFVETGCVEEI